jgi:hypothetical protein
MRLAQEELRIATFAAAGRATTTKHILHELTGFVYEYLQDIFKTSMRPLEIPPFSLRRRPYLQKQTT